MKTISRICAIGILSCGAVLAQDPPSTVQPPPNPGAQTPPTVPPEIAGPAGKDSSETKQKTIPAPKQTPPGDEVNSAPSTKPKHSKKSKRDHSSEPKNAPAPASTAKQPPQPAA